MINKRTACHMQDDTLNIERDNAIFSRNMQRFSAIWTAIAIFIVVLTNYTELTDHPDFLHDWHAIAVIGLSLGILAVYGFILLGRKERRWPRPLPYALSIWLSLYIMVCLLSLIDNGYVWLFWLAVGLGLGLFQNRMLILLTSVMLMTMLFFLGLLHWPLESGDIGSIVGLSVACFSILASGLLLQRLIGERFQRGHLLEELSEANRELEEAHQRLAESAVKEQELAVLRERTRLAREMHDTLGHALVLISVKLEAAQRLRTRDPERCDRELDATKEIVRQSMNELRASIANLRSPALEREPACRALSRYTREMAQRAGLHVTYDLQPGVEELPEEIEETLWKIGQEALTNIEKHARADNVVLHISRHSGQIVMRIEDDGVGMPLEQCPEGADGAIISSSPDGHYGLSGMGERAEQAGGHLAIYPGDEHGTTVEVNLPLAAFPLSSQPLLPIVEVTGRAEKVR